LPKKTVMVVDDEKPFLKVVEDILKPEGYDVVSAISGEEALDILKKVRPDLILLDFYMPGMSGKELCERIRADNKLKNLKVAFLTVATFSQKDIKELNNLFVLDYIPKPFDYRDLIKRIKKMIG